MVIHECNTRVLLCFGRQGEDHLEMATFSNRCCEPSYDPTDKHECHCTVRLKVNFCPMCGYKPPSDE